MLTFSFVIFIFSNIFFFLVIADSLGKFDMFMHKAVPCKGPKRRDCAHFTATVRPGGRVLTIYLDQLEDSYMEMVKIAAYSTDMDKGTPPVISLQLNKPCDQLVVGETFKLWMGGQKSCLIKKGKYNYTVDAWNFAQKMWGGKFFNGNFTFKSSFYNNKCNFGCTLINVTYFHTH